MLSRIQNEIKVNFHPYDTNLQKCMRQIKIKNASCNGMKYSGNSLKINEELRIKCFILQIIIGEKF
jgi:hypothetical protein